MDHDNRPDGFTPLEVDIRNAFDKALDGLERFHSYLETNLVELSDLAPYLKYWAVTIYRPRSPRAETHRISRLVTYMERYGYEGAASLLQKVARHTSHL